MVCPDNGVLDACNPKCIDELQCMQIVLDAHPNACGEGVPAQANGWRRSSQPLGTKEGRRGDRVLLLEIIDCPEALRRQEPVELTHVEVPHDADVVAR